MTVIEIERAKGEFVLGYLASRILKVLRASPSDYGMCACLLASRVKVLETRLYGPLSELLARELVDISVPSEAPRPELETVQVQVSELLENTREEVRVLATRSERAEAWFNYFRQVGDLDLRPRYHLAITRTGSQRLRREDRGSFLREVASTLLGSSDR